MAETAEAVAAETLAAEIEVVETVDFSTPFGSTESIVVPYSL